MFSRPIKAVSSRPNLPEMQSAAGLIATVIRHWLASLLSGQGCRSTKPWNGSPLFEINDDILSHTFAVDDTMDKIKAPSSRQLCLLCP
jgi:hypothetical protein